MTKTEKKLEQQLIEALTEVCEIAKENLPGFQWITHEVNFKQWPKSLRVICQFENQGDLSKALHSKRLINAIIDALNSLNIPISQNQITFQS